MTDSELADWLRQQFSDLDGAKRFMRRFVEMDEELPDGAISIRALAAHASAALEGIPVPSIGMNTNMAATKYGYELYWAALGC